MRESQTSKQRGVKMKKILLLKGLPASGKSTWAKKQVEDFPSLYKRINKDDLREMMDGSKFNKSNERFVLRTRNMLIRECLTEGVVPIVDDTNFNPVHEETIRQIAKEFDAAVEIKEFNTPLAECIARDRKREKSVGDKVIRNMWEKYLKPSPKAFQPRLNTAIICDIDGTIAKMNGRSPYDESKVRSDLPVEEVIRVLDMFKKGMMVEIVLLSGRHETCKDDTKAWLAAHNVSYDHLFMRKEDDDRADYIIKKELYDEHVNGKFNVLFVMDDRNQVVDLWRSLGLKCFQVDYGDF